MRAPHRFVAHVALVTAMALLLLATFQEHGGSEFHAAIEFGVLNALIGIGFAILALRP